MFGEVSVSVARRADSAGDSRAYEPVLGSSIVGIYERQAAPPHPSFRGWHCCWLLSRRHDSHRQHRSICRYRVGTHRSDDPDWDDGDRSFALRTRLPRELREARSGHTA